MTTDTDLRAAVAEIKRVTKPNDPWGAGDLGVGSAPIDYHIATILNAVVYGDLIPRADVGELVEALSKPTSDGERATFSRVGHKLAESSWHLHLAGFRSEGDAMKALAALTAWENLNG